MAGVPASPVFGAPSLKQACEQGLEQVLNKALSPMLGLALIPCAEKGGPSLPHTELGTTAMD